jgi:hypothetical protein
LRRDESDREDLLREASALRRRIELRWPGRVEPVVAGFFEDQRLAIYLTAETVYQFDPEGRLRRAFIEGRLYRTGQSTLAELTRERSINATQLRRRDLPADELEEFFRVMRNDLAEVRDAIHGNPSILARQIPEDEPILPRLIERLNAILSGSSTLAPAMNTGTMTILPDPRVHRCER